MKKRISISGFSRKEFVDYIKDKMEEFNEDKNKYNSLMMELMNLRQKYEEQQIGISNLLAEFKDQNVTLLEIKPYLDIEG